MNNRADSIYQSITKKEIGRLFIVGSLIGMIVFFFCYGWQVLNVTDDSWLLNGQDISQHYIGWKFFRASEWHFPLGQIDGIIYPDVSSIVFTDSIPLFAIFFKILSPILPDTFQYFGIWGLMTYFLIGGISPVILRKSTENHWLCWIGGGFFCLSPYVLQRMYGHTALAGHWIILLAIAIWIYKPYFSTFRRKTAAWMGLLITVSLVHIYFVPMIMIFMFGFCLQDLIENRQWKENLIFAVAAVVADLGVLSAVGAFSESGSMAEKGLGLYSANINSLINPASYKTLLASLPMRNGQGEGFGYLGLGILLLAGCALGICIAKNKIKKQGAFGYSMAAVLCILFVLAWSPEITLGLWTVFRIPYPSIILKVLEIFRASGRFIWCVGYIIMAASIMTVCRNFTKKIAYLCLGVALILQTADLHWMMLSKREHYTSSSQMASIQSEEWETLAQGKAHLIILPYDAVEETYGSSASYEIANFAIDHEMTINYFPLARTDDEAFESNEEMFIEELLSGTAEDGDKNLYILETEELAEKLGLTSYMIDGYCIGVLH